MALLRETEVPDERDLYPAEDGIPLDDGRHFPLSVFLWETLTRHLKHLGQPAFVVANNFIYYQKGNPRKNVGPDFYVVLGAREDPDRDCWRVWDEGGLLPQVIIELVSKTSRKKDHVTNFEIYRDTLKTANYFLYDNRRHTFAGYKLKNGVYEPLKPDALGRLKCDALKLLLGLQDGWLRWFHLDGTILPTGDELAVHEADEAARKADEAARKADEAARKAENARVETERLRRLLLERGIDPDAP